MPLYSYKGITPTIARDVFIAPNATIIGDVVIGEGSSVWFGAVIRGDVSPIRIGERTNIQDNAVVHVTGGRSSTTIGNDVTIGHLALIHGCTIGSRCLIGMGSIVLDNADIEGDCFIAAGALVTTRMCIPHHAMVMGRPAKIVRQLKDGEVAQIAEASALYTQYARDFMSDVKPI